MPRPNKGLGHVDNLEGDPDSKFRLKLILATLSGEMLVDEVCDELDLGPTQFANLRRQTLQAALDGLKPRPGGRPRKEPEVSVAEMEALRVRNQQLERDLAEMKARVELAILPFLGKGKRGSRGEPGSGG